MPRPEVDDVLMSTAMLWAERSTCSRLHVGAVAAINGRIVASGYNGVVAGAVHCVHAGLMRTCEDAVHAEANVIAFAARHGVALAGASLYTTHAPCINCAKLIINAGITIMYYATEFRDMRGVALLQDNHVEVWRMEEDASR